MLHFETHADVTAASFWGGFRALIHLNVFQISCIGGHAVSALLTEICAGSRNPDFIDAELGKPAEVTLPLAGFVMKLLEYLRSALIRSSRAFVWSATACGLLVLFGFFAAVGYDFYRSTLRMNEQAAANVATLAQQTIARDLELYDLSLRSVLEGVNDPDILYQEPGLRQKILFDRSATAPGLGALVALDENGTIILDSMSYPPREGNFADREYFRVHRDAVHDIGLYVSKPFMARLQEQTWMLSVSRRISKPDGSFGGIVSGTIRISYFERLFNTVAMKSGDRIILLRDDGTLMARTVGLKSEVGTDWISTPIFEKLVSRNKGSFTSDQSMDGVSRLYAFQRLDNLPLIVAVGVSTEQILAPWWSKMSILAGIFAIMAASVVGLVWMLEGELRRRAAAEKAAEELARTDGLTRLANRRWFDEELSRKWAVASRDGRPMSLLMIDVDHFKSFNDGYGHQAGDRALVAIADIIDKAARRPDDLAARYGGEEFAVLLPDTDRRGAAKIAEAISVRARSLVIEHAKSEHKVVTVSIGVATAFPRSGTAQAAFLVRDADAALYRAKEEGRNMVCVSNVMPSGLEWQVSRAS
ncbi:sensor domain-containing diguanylate cyclase [soil metagenome]